ncbi:endonuclease III [Fodinisporobacter ferrooxydans]|uniref:Endonuclease III n=1 Tax=Fodinisporobacter ferrooxydans TaxID=2901836 RepID=A0ABY4CK22_9BACL|nr:endonuclease III [Alicyclobacillaceae bacterium MYW30-H2]
MALPRVKTDEILRILEAEYPDAKCALEHRNAFELLIATILSAQCTDKRVNEITAGLFETYNHPSRFLTLTAEQLEEEIKGCGLFKTKSRNILATCKILMDKYNGEVPKTREELMELPGVGRKTANVVISNAFGVPAIAVDTHVQRVSNRIGLAKSEDPLQTEQQLMKRIPKEKWSDAHHWLIYHGRQICSARSPKCSICPLLAECRHAKQEKVARNANIR